MISDIPKNKEKIIEVPIERISSVNSSLTEQGLEISHYESKKLKPKRVMTLAQSENWTKVLEANKLKRESFKESETDRKREADLLRAEKLLEEKPSPGQS
jgi:translation initiation factor 2B subunit (eIF-2B alpha/beta/delta family)